MFRILELNLHGIGIMSECSRFYTSTVEILSLRSRSKLKRNLIVYLSLSILLPSLRLSQNESRYLKSLD
jgi:hypothetical protein